MKFDPNIVIRPIELSDRDWIIDLLITHWISTRIVTKGKIHDAETLPGFIALISGKRVGLLTYLITNNECEIITLNSLVEKNGVGSMLIEAAKEIAFQSGCNRLWLITTNDNIPALYFYQKRGFQLVAIHKNALEISRQLKPEISMSGMFGIPLRDEIELEMQLIQ